MALALTGDSGAVVDAPTISALPCASFSIAELSDKDAQANLRHSSGKQRGACIIVDDGTDALVLGLSAGHGNEDVYVDILGTFSPMIIPM